MPLVEKFVGQAFLHNWRVHVHLVPYAEWFIVNLFVMLLFLDLLLLLDMFGG